ncbi:MAG TPA: SDR family oxidoreductase [Gemmatimonadaceae bacterium]
MSKPIAVITGASRGIGRAIALRLAGEFEIAAVARSQAELASLEHEVESSGGRCRALVADITDPEAVEKALSGVDARVLVNNAGVGTIKPFMDLSRDEWRQMVDVNFNAMFDVTRAVLPSMIARKSGHIILIGSISGRSAFVGGSCYAATKAAVNAFSESLMLELRDSGIKVSVVNPGSVSTTFGSGWSAKSWALSAQAVADAVAQVIATPPNVLIHRMEIRTLTVPRK